MFKIIDKLHSKPHHVRNRVAFTTALSVTILIFGVWVTTFDFSSTEEAAGVVQQNEKQAASPFSALKKNFEDIKEGLVSSTAVQESTDVILETPKTVSEMIEEEIELEDSEVEYSF